MNKKAKENIHADCRETGKTRPAVRLLLMITGSLAFVFGVVGIVIPVWPTTPFLLLAAACYVRCSKKCYAWLLNHRLFGETIRNYLQQKAITQKIRTRALIFLWISLTVSAILVQQTVVRLLLLLVGLGVSIHLMSLQVLRKPGSNKQKKNPEQTDSNPSDDI